jgi:pre-mRNA-splicing factor ATP-dependent RNA helicase DHX16
VKKLQELKDELIDEAFLFGGMKLTAREQTEHSYKKEICELPKRAQVLDNTIIRG